VLKRLKVLDEQLSTKEKKKNRLENLLIERKCFSISLKIVFRFIWVSPKVYMNIEKEKCFNVMTLLLTTYFLI